MIALYDRDFIERPIDALYNLQLMKLSTYYKQRREIVLLSTSLLPGRHQRTFVRKDYDNGKFPTYDKKYDV